MWFPLLLSNSPVDYVDPLIGTHHAEVGQGVGKVFPAVTPPFGMTQWTPSTNQPSLEPGNWYPSPYYYDGPDSPPTIKGFRGTHFPSGSCMCDYGAVELMVVTGSLKVLPDERKSVFYHSNENATPYYYSVHLDTWNVDVEMTTNSTRCAIFRFTFHESTTAYIVIDTLGVKHGGSVSIDTSGRKITGQDNDRYNDEFTGYFVVQFQDSFADYGTWDRDGSTHPGTTSATWSSNAGGAYVAFNVAAGQQILVKVGTSFVSTSKAEYNLGAEIPDWDFEAVKSSVKSIWNSYLSKIEVVSASEEKKEMFYTALYHLLLLPRVFNDADGEYRSPFDGNTHHGNYYNDYSIWDTYRGVHTLFCLLWPDQNARFIEGLLRIYQEGQWLPKWPNPYYTNVMIGTHADSIIAEAKIKGVPIWDENLAYEALVKDATVSTYPSGGGTTTGPVRYQARWALDSYLDHHYVSADWNKPSDGYTQAVSRTLEYSYDDYCVAQMAKALGKTSDYQTYLNRSFWYRNLFDPDTGFMRPRHDDGSWYEPFDPSVSCLGGYYTESTPWVYTFHVQHDPQGLMNLFGGKEEFSKKLDEFFDKGFFDPTNEPSMHVPYLYVWAGKPWKTQYRVHEAVVNHFGTGPLDGLPGDEDCGQMSAFLIFSMLGFYPVSPVDTYYVIGTPMLEKVVLHLPSGKDLTIIAHDVSDTNIYIQKAALNGVPLNRAWITHAEIMNGGTLEFWMGPQPNKSWGADNPPPSASQGEPEFEVSNVHLSDTVMVAGEPAQVVAHVKNTKFAVGTFNFEVRLNGEVLASKKFVFGPSGTPDGDDEQDVSVEFTIHTPGTYTLDVAGQKIRVLVKAGSPKVVYRNFWIERRRLDSLVFHFDLANEGGWWASESLSVELDNQTVAQKDVEISPGGSVSEDLFVEDVKGGNYSLKVSGLEPSRIEIPGGLSLFKGKPFYLQGLAFYLPLDEGSGDIAVDSISLSRGGVYGTVSWTGGKYGGAFQFDGNTYMKFDDFPALNPERSMTVEAWIYPTDWNGNRRILQKGSNDNQYRFLAEGGALKFDIHGVGTVTASLPSTGSWHHVVGVYNGETGDMEIWVDGVRTGYATVSPAPIPKTTDPLYIGTKNPAAPAGDHFYGRIDEVRIYNRALTADEIKTLASIPSYTSGSYSTNWAPVSTSFRRLVCFSHIPAGCSVKVKLYTSDDGVSVKESIGPVDLSDGLYERALNITSAKYVKLDFILSTSTAGLSPEVLAFAVELADGSSVLWDSFSDFMLGQFENTTAGYIPSIRDFQLGLEPSKGDVEIWFGVREFDSFYVADSRGILPALGTFTESTLMNEDFSDVSDWTLSASYRDSTRGHGDAFSLKLGSGGSARYSSQWSLSEGSIYKMTLWTMGDSSLKISLYPEPFWNATCPAENWERLHFYVQPKYSLKASLEMDNGEEAGWVDEVKFSRIVYSSSGFNLTSSRFYLDIDTPYETSLSDSYVALEYTGSVPDVFYFGADSVSCGKRKATCIYSFYDESSGRGCAVYVIKSGVFANLLENGADVIVSGNGRIFNVWISKTDPVPPPPELTERPGGIYVGFPGPGTYAVYRKFGDQWRLIGEYSYPGFLDTDVEKGKTYSYRLAKHLDGFFSPLSKEATLKVSSVLGEGEVVVEKRIYNAGEPVKFIANFGEGSLLKLDVFSLSGVRIYGLKKCASGVNEVLFPTEGLSPGIYMALIELRGNVTQFRIILRR